MRQLLVMVSLLVLSSVASAGDCASGSCSRPVARAVAAPVTAVKHVTRATLSFPGKVLHRQPVRSFLRSLRCR